MPETTIQTPPGFSQLSKAEQIQYLQALWDQIAANPDTLPVPEIHLRLIEHRLKLRDVDPSPTHSAFDVLDRLENGSK